MKKIRVGLVGLGFSGSLHADAYAAIKDKANLVAVCDIDKEKTKMMAWTEPLCVDRKLSNTI